MKQIGFFHTPYGVAVPTFEDTKDPDEHLFDMVGTAVCMGIYDPADRQRFADYVKETGKVDFMRFGGHKLLISTES